MLHTVPRNLPTPGRKCHSHNLVLTKKPKLDWVWSLLFRAFISQRWCGELLPRRVQHVIVSGGSLCVPPLVMPQSSGENKFRKSHWNSKWQSIGIITKVSKTALRLVIAVLMCSVAGCFKHVFQSSLEEYCPFFGLVWFYQMSTWRLALSLLCRWGWPWAPDAEIPTPPQHTRLW